jgi:predicted lipid-binding transport protein (Tim44 family)
LQNRRPRTRISYRAMSAPSPAGGWLGKVLTAVLAGAALVAGVMFSIFFLAILVGVGLVAGGYLWWKTRALRRQLREQFAAMQARAADAKVQGDVIEGEFSRSSRAEDGPDERLQDRTR